MRSFKLPKCPFCGRKLNFLDLWLHKSEGEFTCEKCGNVSSVLYDSLIYVTAALAAGVAVLFTILYAVTASNPRLSFIFLILLPFVLFYLAVPYMVRLKRKNAVSQNTARSPLFSEENKPGDPYKTKELPPIGKQAQPSHAPVPHGGRRPQTFAEKAVGGLEHVGFFMHNVVKSITQNDEPAHKSQQGNRPPQSMRPPQQGERPQQRPPEGTRPAPGMRPPQNMRPPQQGARPQQRPPEGARPAPGARPPQGRPPQSMRPPQQGARPQQRPPEGTRPAPGTRPPQGRPPQNMRPPQQGARPQPPQRPARGSDFDVQSIIDELNMRGSAQR